MKGTTPTEIGSQEFEEFLSGLNDDEIMTAYMDAKERKSKAKAAADRAETVMLHIKKELLQRLNDRGSDGFKVAGVARVSVVEQFHASIGDSDRFFKWMLSQADVARGEGKDPLEALAYIQRRVTVDAIRSYMAEHDGMAPPAINTSTTREVRVTAI